MVSLIRSKNYSHLSLLDEDGRLRPKPILIVGGSGSGKTILEETAIDELKSNNKKLISIFLVDVDDVFESAFCMFPASDKVHLRILHKYMKEKKAMDNVRLHYIYGRNLKYIGKRIPEGDIITFSVKRTLQRAEIMFLLEQPKETRGVTLLLNISDKLKDDEGLKFVRRYARELTERKKIYYLGKEIDVDEDVLAEKKDLKDIIGALQLFDYDGLIMRDSFRHNFNPQKILNDPGSTHIFIYKGLKQDKKLRDFVFFHLFNEICRYLADCKYQVALTVEETQSLAPDEKEGYKAVMGSFTGDNVGLVRKTARGVWVFMVGRVWNKIHPSVRSECKKQIIFHLEQDDMLKFVKVRSLSGKIRQIMENLRTGECVLRGHESRVIQVKPPCFGHKHTQMHFIEEYKKSFPDKLTNYSDIFKEIITEHKNQEKKYNELRKQEIEAKKALIRKVHLSKQKEVTGKEQLKKYKKEEKERKKQEKEKRDNEVIKVYQEIDEKKEIKPSYRNISKILKDRGIKASFVTVKKVLDSLHTPEREQEKIEK